MKRLARRARPPVVPPHHTLTRPPVELPAQLLRRLEFKVVRRLDGFLFGDYRGLFYGPSLDLAEVREYQPGDEVRRMDWNVTARSGKLHVRQYREERELTAWLVVDTSSSMNFGTRRALKRDVALEFAGVAALVITRHGDKVGAVTFGNTESEHLHTLPPRTGRAQAMGVLNLLTRQVTPTPTTGAPPSAKPPTNLHDALTTVQRTLRRRSLVLVVSDFLEPVPEAARGWTAALGQLAQRHDVIAVRVSDPAERVLPNVGGLRLRDPESGAEHWIDTSDPRVRAAHARLVAERDANLKRALRAAQVDLMDLDTQLGPVQPLLKFTMARRGRRA